MRRMRSLQGCQGSYFVYSFIVRIINTCFYPNFVHIIWQYCIRSLNQNSFKRLYITVLSFYIPQSMMILMMMILSASMKWQLNSWNLLLFALERASALSLSFSIVISIVHTLSLSRSFVLGQMSNRAADTNEQRTCGWFVHFDSLRSIATARRRLSPSEKQTSLSRFAVFTHKRGANRERGKESSECKCTTELGHLLFVSRFSQRLAAQFVLFVFDVAHRACARGVM